MKHQFQAFLAALQFLTRLRLSWQANTTQSFRQSILYFPLVGLLLGLILAGFWELSFLLPAPVRAVLLLTLAVYFSGGLHLDGFIDSIDGLFSGRERERMLAIMKDSHVGAHGVTAIIILLLLKYSLLISLPFGHLWLFNIRLSPVILLMPVLSRWAVLPAMTCYPYARQEGVGSLFDAGRGHRSLLTATFITGLLSWLAMGATGLLLLFLAGLASIGWSSWVKRMLGGLTGDTYGALIEITEVVVLATGLILSG